jgi:Cache 3/Cache 2 fusion domain
MKNFVLSGIFLFTQLSFANFASAADDPKVGVALLKEELNKLGAPKIDGKSKVGDKDVSAIYFGKTRINLNYATVDAIKTKVGGTATVFVKDGEEFVRVSTNVKKEDGTRAVGTPLARNKAYESIMKNEMFCGEVEILGSKYDTCYDPISAEGKVVGIYYFGFKK